MKVIKFIKKELKLLIFMVLFLTLGLGTTGYASAQTHHVYPGGSIQTVINWAYPGDTIIVHNGTYTENVYVNKRITLKGEGADVVSVEAKYSGSHVFKVNADYVHISGFKVTGATEAEATWDTENQRSGIYISRTADHCNINNNTASNNNCGISLIESSNHVISNNTVLNNHDGIYLLRSSNNTITNSIILNNLNGIHLDDSINNIFTNNNISKNNFGIHIYYSHNNHIYNNYFNNIYNAYDNGNNIWNITKTAGTNIMGGSYLGGNYWSDYNGFDTNGDGLGDTDLPYFSSWYILHGCDYYPLIPVSSNISNNITDIKDATRTFYITFNQTANITWYINGIVIQTNNTTTNATYTNTSAVIGTWNVSAIVKSTNNSFMHTWMWYVNAPVPGTSVDICVNPNGWWRNSTKFNPSSKPIQSAVNEAFPGEIIYVMGGNYIESVRINKRITLLGESTDIVTVNPVETCVGTDHVFAVFADYVNISGFNLTGAHRAMCSHVHEYYMAGVYLASNSNHCNIYNNKLYNNDYGVYIYESYNNIISNNGGNICIEHADNNNVLNNSGYIHLLGSNSNTALNNNDTFIILENSYNNTLLHNNGKTIRLEDSHNNTLSNNNVSNSMYHYGISLEYSSNNKLLNNTISNNDRSGISLYCSSNNIFLNNTVSNNYIEIIKSSYNKFIDNYISSDDWANIYFFESNNNTFVNNTLKGRGLDIHESFCNKGINNSINGKPLAFYSDISNINIHNAGQVVLVNCFNITIQDLNISNINVGITLLNTHDCKIINNIITNNSNGIYLDGSDSNNNLIYNNYFNNTKNICTYNKNNNIWNIKKTAGINIVGGPYLGGNYWSDYTGVDKDTDGLGDTNIPYTIRDGGDYLPLVPYDATSPDITINQPLESSPVYKKASEQFQVKFIYTESHPKNYTVSILNNSAVINEITNTNIIGGTGLLAQEKFYLNATAADGWYNVKVEMYDDSLNYNIEYQNNSVVKGIYDCVISQPANQTTNVNVTATYILRITNTGNFTGSFMLAATNHDSVDVAVLDKTVISDLPVGTSFDVTLDIMDTDAGTYNVTVNVVSIDSKNEVANTGYIMTTVQETAPPDKNEQVPGFEYKFTITVLLAVTYLMLHRRGMKG